MRRSKGAVVVLAGVLLLLLFLLGGSLLTDGGGPSVSQYDTITPAPPRPPPAPPPPPPPRDAEPPAAPGDPEEDAPGDSWWERHITDVTVRVVRAEDGGPLPEAEVVWSMDGEPDRRAATGDDGTARFRGFPERRFRVVARAPGRVREWAEVSQDDVAGRETRDDDGALLLSLEAGVPLVGVVLAAAGRRPVAGARVAALLGGEIGGEFEVAGDDDRLGTVETGADGRFTAPAVPPDRIVSLVVEHPDFLEADRTLRLPAGGPPGEPLEFLLEPAASVRGVVLGVDGLPAPGAEVRAVPLTRVQWGEEEDTRVIRWPRGARRGDPLMRDVGGAAVSGPDGTFAIGSLRPEFLHRVYALVESGDGEGRRSAVAEVTTPPAGGSAAVELRLQALSGLAVRVVDPDGGPVGRALVTLAPDEGVWPDDEERTGEAGVARFSEVLPGPWRVAVHSNDFADASAAAVVEGSGPPATLEVRLLGGLAVEGVLVDDAGDPVPGREVLAYRLLGDGSDPHAFDEGVRYRSAKSGTDGRFRIGGLRAGFHALCLSGVSGERLAVEAPAAGVRFVLPRPASAVARLVFPAGAAVPAADSVVVTTVFDDGGMVSGGNEGAFDGEHLRLTGFPTGRNSVAIEAPGWARVVRSFRSAPGETVDLGEIAMSPGVPVRGRVLDPAGRPVAGVGVEPEWYVREAATTDREGRFLLEHMPEGRLLLQTRAEGWPDGEVSVEAGPDTPEVAVYLVHGGTVKGVIRRGDGRGVPGAVCFRRPGTAERERHPEAHSDEGGRFTIHLAPGTWLASPWTGDGKGPPREFEVVAGGEIAVELPAPGR